MALFHTTVVDNQIKALDTIGTATGSIATFDTDREENLINLEVAITATGGGGTPVSPIAINGFSACNLVHYNENLFTSMPTATNDGITTSYDSNTGLISIRNDSRTTNYGYGSQRGIVASGLNPNHTYKFAIYPNVLGVTLSNTGSIELDNPFTGYSTAVLRVTSQYDFVNVHPIGDITTVKLFIFDMTDGYGTTETISFGQTVYGGRLNVGSGVLTVTDKEVELSSLSWNYVSANKVFICGAISDIKLPATTGTIPDWLCSCFALNSGANVYNNAVANDNSIGCLATKALGISYQDAQGDLTALSAIINNQKLVYELETPLIIQLDSKQIQAIIGTNNVYSDTGDIIDLKFVLSVGKAIQ